MSYCDYIAHLIYTFLREVDENHEGMLKDVESIEYDLSEDGSFLSTKKTIDVTDVTGKKYRITVEEL
jgi:hypothetical protein